MSDTSYPIEIKPAPKSGYFTPEESNNYYAARYARTGITVHWWGDGTGASNHDNIVNYINDQAAKAIKSVNYVLSDNKITMCVSPDDVAWCSEKGNPTTISVETQPTLGDEGYKKWGWLVDQLEKRYGHVLQLHRHSEWTQTACPGSINLDRIRAEADKWKSGTYDAPEAPLWTTEAITPRNIKVKPGSHKWNLGHHDFDSVAANPITTADDNTHFTATAILHHRNIPQYNYYLEDPSTPHGWNVIDCLDYIAPIPPPPPPAAPVPFPEAEKYTLLATLIYFPTAEDAQQRTTKAQGTIDEGVYYVVGRDQQAIKLSKDNKTDIGWINTFDNRLPLPAPVVATLPVDPPPVVIEPVDFPPQISDVKPVEPKPQYHWIQNNQAITMVSTNSMPIPIHDLEGKYPDQQLPAHWRGEYSMYTVIKGQTYYLPDKTRNCGWFYGVPETMLERVKPVLDRNHNGRNDIIDFLDDGLQGFIVTGSKYLDGIKAAVTTITPKIQPTKQRIGKAVDGFSRKK